jgi:hypothetical protein
LLGRRLRVVQIGLVDLGKCLLEDGVELRAVVGANGVRLCDEVLLRQRVPAVVAAGGEGESGDEGHGDGPGSEVGHWALLVGFGSG